MASTTPLGFPLVDLTDIPNGPAQLDALAQALDAYLTLAAFSPIPLLSGYALQNAVPSYAIRFGTVKLADAAGFTTARLEVTPAGALTVFLATGQTSTAWVSLDGLEYELTVALS